MYLRVGFNNKEIISLLLHKHDVVISAMMLKIVQKEGAKSCICSEGKNTNLEGLASFVQNEIAGNE